MDGEVGAGGAPGRPNTFEVDLGAIAHNVGEVRRLVGAETRIFAALKANAYGFGLLDVAETVLAAGAEALAVVDARDAVALRKRGVTAPILLYGGMPATPELVACVERYDLMPTLLSAEDAALYSRQATASVRVFVKVEVGLERLGVAAEEAPALVATIRGLPNLELHGVYAHLHVPDGDATALRPYLSWQFGRYEQAIAEIEQAGTPIPIKMAASTGVLRLTTGMNLNAVDPGHLLFGIRPAGAETTRLDLRPAFFALKSRLVQVRPVTRTQFTEQAPFPLREGMRVGVMPIGLADGMAALHGGSVLVGGERTPILGVSLEHTRIDVTDVAAWAGDEVVIVGRQGSEAIAPDEVAAFQGYRLPTMLPLSIQQTVRRVYVDHSRGNPDHAP